MKKKTLEFVLLVLFQACVFQGCASLDAEFPTSRMDIPEVIGTSGKRAQIGLGYSSTQLFTIASDASARPPTLNQPSFRAGAEVSGAAAYGLMKRLDVGVKATTGSSPTFLQAKFQLLGKPGDEADPGNVSLAVTGAWGFANISKSGDQRGIFGPGGYRWTSTTQESVSDFALILGYRASESTLFYGGVFMSKIAVDASIDQAQSDNGTSPAANYKTPAYRGTRNGANAGIQITFGKAPGFITAEAVYSDLQFSDQVRSWDIGYGANIGAYF